MGGLNIMLALTVRQPWAWAIMHAGKDVENRSWSTEHRGRLAIHAATKLWAGGDDDIYALTGRRVPPKDELIRGAVIGTVELLGCVRDHDSPWAADGQWHWVLHDPRPLAVPLPYRGQPGLFNVRF